MNDEAIKRVGDLEDHVRDGEAFEEAEVSEGALTVKGQLLDTPCGLAAKKEIERRLRELEVKLEQLQTEHPELWS